MAEEERTRTLILGIGNVLLKDEGAGVKVVSRLSELNPGIDGIDWMDGGTLSFTLAPEVEASRYLIVVDVAQMKSPPGTVKTFVDDEMDRMLSASGRSVHEVGLLDLMDMARLSEALPERKALVGIQPEAIEWGDEPTPPVAAALPAAQQAVAGLVEQWTGIRLNTD